MVLALPMSTVGPDYPSAGDVLMVDVVTFRLVMFRPFKGEIIEGRISNTYENGISG